MPTLSLDDLYLLDDTHVKTKVNATFLEQIRNSPSVKPVFFSGAAPAPAPANAGFVDGLAVAMACSSIASSSLFGFSKCINAGAAQNYWQSRLTDSVPEAVAEGQKLYEWAFPDHCKSAASNFRHYLDNPAGRWGAQLADHVTTPQFITVQILKVLAQPNWLSHLNLVFYKIKKLDAAQLDRVKTAWTRAYPDKGIIDTWEKRTFIPAANFATVPTQFIGEVNAAISAKSQIGVVDEFITDFVDPPPGAFGSRVTPRPPPRKITKNKMAYGAAVQQFLNGAPNRMGFFTNARPANEVLEDQPAACFAAGTRVLLEGGVTAAIEEVRCGDVVVSRDGVLSWQSPERVVTELPEPDVIYGIDDGVTQDEPFFSAGHLFWTAEGWKAIDPAIARMENPWRQIGALGIGDTVYRWAAGRYEEVRIEGFTQAVVPAGTRLYGLHLVEGPPSYHANGYLVGMNYPQFTVGRLTEGFARLSDAERAHLRQCLTEAMPLLRYSVGPFLESALRLALDGSAWIRPEL